LPEGEKRSFLKSAGGNSFRKEKKSWGGKKKRRRLDCREGSEKKGRLERNCVGKHNGKSFSKKRNPVSEGREKTLEYSRVRSREKMPLSKKQYRNAGIDRTLSQYP